MLYDFKDLKKNESLPQIVVDFLNYLETIRGKSTNTLDAYKVDLTMFFRFLKLYRDEVNDKNTEFEDIIINDIDNAFIKKIRLSELYAFMSFLEKYRNNSAYARARKVATLKSFFKYLQNKVKIIDENPTLELESPKINKRHPIYLNLDESIKLLNSIDKKSKNYYRDYCIITLFLNCGMRLSELCNIKLEKISGDTLTIIGKGEIQTLPAPFWYFVPRKTDSVPEIASVQSSETENQSKNENSEKSENDSKNEKILRQQLGLFKDKANAEGLVLKLKEKGFSPHITEEIRPSGTKYYLVVVDENKAGSIGNELRNAGFECYPIFE